MPNTALKLDQIYTARFTTGVAQPANIYPNNGPTVIDLQRRRRRSQRDFREMVLQKEMGRPRRRRKRERLTIKKILQGGLEVGAFGTILATFMGSLWALAQ